MIDAPDRIGAWPKSNDPTSGGWDVRAAKVTQYLRADGPTITAYREALRLLGVDPDSIAREALKEAGHEPS